MCAQCLSKQSFCSCTCPAFSMVAVRCCGTTKAGQRCSITSLSSMRDSAGRFVADPLRKGGAFCMMHTVLFSRMPMQSCDFVIAYIDLETNSLDPCTGKIVEIGALVDGSRGMFSTVVCPGHDVSLDEDPVHGIPHGELMSGPWFAEAFARLDQFLRHASLSVLESDDDSEDGSLSAVVMKQDLEVALVAHNGAKFDFPFLLSECMRAGIGPAVMSSWIYIDTLDVLRATDRAGECKKLQCALRVCSGPPTLRAHRALDDCIALEAVVRHVSASLGIRPWALLRPFALRLDETSTVAQMNALLS